MSQPVMGGQEHEAFTTALNKTDLKCCVRRVRKANQYRIRIPEIAQYCNIFTQNWVDHSRGSGNHYGNSFYIQIPSTTATFRKLPLLSLEWVP